MRINRKLRKRLVKKPFIRPHIIKSLTAFDQEINQHQNVNWADPAKRKTSDTIDLLRFLVQEADSHHRFKIGQNKIMQKLDLNVISYNFNFSALYQLKMIKLDWQAFKVHHKASGTININQVF